MIDVPAIDKPIPIDINKKLTGQTNPVAANSTDPILLTHNPSTKLYSVCIKLFIIIGIAKTPITLYKSSFKIKFLLFLTMFPPKSHLNFLLLLYILYTIDTINFYKKLRMSKYIFF